MKKFIAALLCALCLSVANAQNPTVIRAGSGISVSPASGVGIVTISASGGAGTVTNIFGVSPIVSTPSGGGTAFTITFDQTANLTLSGNNSFAGTSLFTGRVTNTSGLVVTNSAKFVPGSDPEIKYNNGVIGFTLENGSSRALVNNANGQEVATFPGRLRTSTAAESIHVENRYLAYGNSQISAFWWSGNPGFAVNGTFTNYGTSYIASNQFVGQGLSVVGAQTNFGSFIVTNLINSNVREMYNEAGTLIFRFGIGQYALNDSSGTPSIAYNARALGDSLGNTSLDYGNRLARNAAGIDVFEYGTGELIDFSGSKVYNWTNQTFKVSHTFNSNITVVGSVIVQTTNGQSLVSSGTNNTMLLQVNGGAGTLQTSAMLTQRTNILQNGTVITPAVNTIYTNDIYRRTVTVAFVLPQGAAACSAVAAWTLSGGITNFTFPVMSQFNATQTAVTNSLFFTMQPSALYMFTNINTAAGAPSVAVPFYRESDW